MGLGSCQKTRLREVAGTISRKMGKRKNNGRNAWRGDGSDSPPDHKLRSKRGNKARGNGLVYSFAHRAKGLGPRNLPQIRAFAGQESPGRACGSPHFGEERVVDAGKRAFVRWLRKEWSEKPQKACSNVKYRLQPMDIEAVKRGPSMERGVRSRRGCNAKTTLLIYLEKKPR